MNIKYKILLATDYSEAVMNAEHYAVQFAKATNSILVLMHVYERPLPVSDTKENTDKIFADVERVEEEKLKDHCGRLFRSLNIKQNEIMYECIVRAGINVGRTIRNASSEEGVNFIIVGTHGASGFRDIFFGSHAWDVIKKSSIPVLAIPQDALFAGINNIVFGTEYREGEIPVLNFLTQFAKQFDAEVTVLHSTNYILTKAFEKEMFEKFRRDIKAKNSYKKLNIQLINSENVAEGISKFCEHKKIDLLVLSPEKPFLLERIFNPLMSTSRKMVFHSTVPLMTVPDFYNPEYLDFWKHFTQGDYVNEDF